MKHLITSALVVFLLFTSSCKKEAGGGGTSTIQGKVFASYYNKNFTLKAASGFAGDIDVYIIYGDEYSFGDRTRTSYDGAYQFKYLRPGKYRVFAYSKDSTGAYKNQANQFAPDIAVVKPVEVTKGKETVEVPQINIIQ